MKSVARWASLLLLASGLVAAGCKKKAGKPGATASPSASASPGAAAPDAGAAASERWAGKVELPGGAKLEFEVRFRADKPPRAKIAIPSQGVPPTELTDVEYGEVIAFTLQQPGVKAEALPRFSARRAADGKTAEGTLKQNGMEMVLRLRRLAEGETLEPPKRPQTPAPPFPYDERPADIKGADGVTLAGTLTVPRDGGPHPALLLITGTGAQDRDETVFDHKPFGVLADHLTRAGFAVLRLDDRGIGGSGGDTGASDHEVRITDNLAALAWLAAQPGIDPARLGLIGHSEGGTVAPMITVRAAAGKGPKVAFLVLLAGTGLPGVEVMRSQMELLTRAQGAPPEVLARVMAGQKRLLDAVMAKADLATLRAAVVKQVEEALTDVPGLPEAQKQQMIDGAMAAVSSAAAQAFIRSDPQVALAKVTCPVLALGGSLDLQVPAQANLDAIKAALAKAKNTDVTTEVLPGLNHLFQPAKVGVVEEYGEIETTFDPGALDKVTSWLKSHAGVK